LKKEIEEDGADGYEDEVHYIALRYINNTFILPLLSRIVC